MNQRVSSIFLCLGILVVSMADSREARATLGEGAESVAKDCQRLSAVKRATTTHAKYTVQQLTSDATVVREYISSSGTVFGVAWKGVVQPDLSVLLGSYAKEYQEAKRKLPRTHGKKQSQVKGDRVVVETWGHMRNMQGRAYVPELLPEGVNAHEIQ